MTWRMRPAPRAGADGEDLFRDGRLPGWLALDAGYADAARLIMRISRTSGSPPDGTDPGSQAGLSP